VRILAELGWPLSEGEVTAVERLSVAGTIVSRDMRELPPLLAVYSA
jgi:hypothetical protein